MALHHSKILSEGFEDPEKPSQSPIPTAPLGSQELKEDTFEVDFPYGSSRVQSWAFEGISTGFMKSRYNGFYSFEKMNEEDVVHLQFNLKGAYHISHIGHEYFVEGRQHNIIYTPRISNTFENKELEGETFYVQFSPEKFLQITQDGNDTLKRFAENIMEGRPTVIGSRSLYTTPAMHIAIEEVRNCRYQGGMRKIFLLSKCLEILVMQAEAYDQASHATAKSSICKTPDDRERLHYAHEYLLQHLVSPPSLSQLSREAGLNEYKLKKGFRELFGNTVFGCLSEHRLKLGLQKLQDTQLSVSEIAYELGYSSPQHFSSAFSKKFGFPPRNMRK